MYIIKNYVNEIIVQNNLRRWSIRSFRGCCDSFLSENFIPRIIECELFNENIFRQLLFPVIREAVTNFIILNKLVNFLFKYEFLVSF